MTLIHRLVEVDVQMKDIVGIADEREDHERRDRGVVGKPVPKGAEQNHRRHQGARYVQSVGWMANQHFLTSPHTCKSI